MLISLVACSSSTATSGAGDSGLSGDPINIGAIGSYSGALESTFGGMPKVYQAWADWVNANGGINGRPVNVIVKDIAGSASGGVRAVSELIGDDEVVAIFNEDATDTTWVEKATGADVPVIGTLTLSSIANPGIFNPSNAIALIIGTVDTAQSVGNTMGMVVCAELPNCTASGEIVLNLAREKGLDVPVYQRVASSAPDLTATCEAFKSANVDSFYIGGSSAFVERVTDTCRSAGLTATLVVSGTLAANATTTQDAAFDNSTFPDFAAPFFNTQAEGSKQYREVIEQYTQNLVGSPLDNPYSAIAWIRTQIFQKAASSISGDITGAALKESLYGFEDETVGGMSGPLNFVRGEGSLNTCYFTYGISGQEWIWTDPEPICVDKDEVRQLTARLTPAG